MKWKTFCVDILHALWNVMVTPQLYKGAAVFCSDKNQYLCDIVIPWNTDSSYIPPYAADVFSSFALAAFLMRGENMTDNQRKFADEYIKDGNATRAYKAAYPHITKDATAAQAGYRLLRNVKVKTYIDERLQKISDEKTADAKEVMETVTAILRRELEEEIPTVVGTGNGYGEIVTVTKKPSVKDVMSAATLLARIFGMDKTKISVDGAVPVIFAGDDALE